MADEIHRLITGTIWPKLKDDVRDFRVFSRHDLACAAYFHIRRLLLAQPGWSCRANPPLGLNERRPPLPCPDLALFSGRKLQALFQFEFHLTPGMNGGFPTSVMNERMTALRRAVENVGHSPPDSSSGRGYLVAVYDTKEEWFYPDQAAWEEQSCFWLPVNSRGFGNYTEWQHKWERLARLSSH